MKRLLHAGLIFFFVISAFGQNQNRALDFRHFQKDIQLTLATIEIEKNDQFTVAFWVKPSQDSSTQNILTFQSGSSRPLKIDLNPSNSVKVSRRNDSYEPQMVSSTLLPVNVWSLISVVKNQKMLLLYINGKLEGFVNNNVVIENSENTVLKLGGREEGQAFNGGFDLLQLWEESIDAPTMISLFQQGQLDSPKPSLIFDFEEEAKFLNTEIDSQAWIDGPAIKQDHNSRSWYGELSQAVNDYRSGNGVNLSTQFMWESIFMALAFVLVSYLTYIFLLKRRKRIAVRKELEMQGELDYKQKELVSQTLHLVNKNSLLKDLKDDLTTYQKSSEKSIKEINKIIRDLQFENASEANWEVFKSQFLAMHNDFDKKLRSINEKITDQDIRLAALVKMKLSNKEIAEMLNVQAESIKKSKFRLKKKLGLTAHDSLDTFLLNL
ncbi:LamG-like jellyroll fold domain-containing protein [Jiulongibacter sp. NS-SX5]|uniref:LamG-like jellyroll fold domain-containing protein n=1 Tax=Jiulongibacter sp. NS-SX5 TaxID=3463854 RepID=UPI004059A148